MTDPVRVGAETPEADAAEQAVTAFPDRFDEENVEEAEPTLDTEAPEWDVQEQRMVVHEMDDDYR